MQELTRTDAGPCPSSALRYLRRGRKERTPLCGNPLLLTFPQDYCDSSTSSWPLPARSTFRLSQTCPRLLPPTSSGQHAAQVASRGYHAPPPRPRTAILCNLGLRHNPKHRRSPPTCVKFSYHAGGFRSVRPEATWQRHLRRPRPQSSTTPRFRKSKTQAPWF